MASKYQIHSVNQNNHFSKAPFGEVEKSRMVTPTRRLTTFNAGDIVPIYCREVLPEEDLSIDIDFVIRQTTLLTPTMDNMHVDIYAFWVPNRIVNQSWKAVEGENFSGSWVSPSVSLVPLKNNTTGETQIPVGSVADYYDYPTQKPIANAILNKCHDLKFRGYVMIYNEHFRDQNYQPPIPLSTINVYQGFLDSRDNNIFLGVVNDETVPDGNAGGGAIANAIYGSGKSGIVNVPGNIFANGNLNNTFKGTDKPLKANKLHDYFTSGLPSPQKSGSAVLVPVTGNIGSVAVTTANSDTVSGVRPSLRFTQSNGISLSGTYGIAVRDGTAYQATSIAGTNQYPIAPSNLMTEDGAEIKGASIDISDIRMAAAIQQVYEILARGGSRYRSIVATFFGVDYDNPFVDVPSCLGHISRDLDLYQTAQTSESVENGTPQGNLAAFGYTANGGHLFNTHFVEHGYVHIFAVVRHRNVYASYMPRDNFRLNMLDFYTPPLANISEQPVYTREINPFISNPDQVFAYQEAWAEYRYEPDLVSGLMRTMPEGKESLSVWNYADDFDSTLAISNGEWLKSNSEEVLNRTLAIKSDIAPQFKAAFLFKVDKTLPMPTYSVPGMDII